MYMKYDFLLKKINIKKLFVLLCVYFLLLNEFIIIF